MTPSFEQAQYLERAMRSILDQGYPRTEYLVLDGGSTDGSRAIIERYADRLAYWRSASDGGQAAAVNEGWSRSTGDILGWLNSDDLYLPGTLERVADWFDGHPDSAVVYGRCWFVDADGKRIRSVGSPFSGWRFAATLQTVPQPALFVRRSAWEQTGPLDESLRYAMDYDFFLRLFERFRPSFLDADLAAATIHRAAKTTADRAVAKREAIRVAQDHASGPMKLAVRLIDAGATLYHRLPRVLRSLLDAIRRHPTRYA